MSQQINLLNIALIKKKDLFNLNNTVLLAGLFSILMLAYYGYAKTELNSLTQQKHHSAENVTASQEALKKLTQAHAPRQPNLALKDQIVALENKSQTRQQVLKTVELSATKPDAGYAEIMKAFARQKIEGLWLTGFSIDNQSDQLNIKGNALQAVLVPEYIARLSREPVLQGKLFSTLNMNQHKVDASTTNQPVATEVSTKSTTSPAAKPAIPTALATPSYIEFSLKSVKNLPVAEIAETKSANEQPIGGEKS